MLDLKKAYGFSKNKANFGVTHVFGPDPETDWVTICRTGSSNANYSIELKKAYRDAHSKLTLLKTQGEAGEAAAAELDTRIHTEVVAKTIVTNWGTGIADGDTPLAPTLENRIKVLTDFPEFKEACMVFASNRLNYPMEEEVEEVKK